MPWTWKSHSPTDIPSARLWYRIYHRLLQRFMSLRFGIVGDLLTFETQGISSLCTWNSCPNITKNFASHSSSLHPVGSRTSRYPNQRDSLDKHPGHWQNTRGKPWTNHDNKENTKTCHAWAAKSMLPKVLCLASIRSA